MDTLKGVSIRIKKNGKLSYRSSITYKNKHISLGTYSNKEDAYLAYTEANNIVFNNMYTFLDYKISFILPFEKWVILHNYRDNGYYFKTPIYLSKDYFSYFLDKYTELFFNVDDLFYYSNHKILKRNGYLFVNDYGMQINILSRYGIKNYAVEGKDYIYRDGNHNNLRYDNILVINRYHGVEKIIKNHKEVFEAKININGYYIIGKYSSDVIAAIAYNKAADYLNNNNICSKDFPRNYIIDIDSSTYKKTYEKTKISSKILSLKLS
jgi:hypothetical protein